VRRCSSCRGCPSARRVCRRSASSIDFFVRWWAGSTPIEEHRSHDKAVAAIKAALDAAGIEIPFPYRTLTFKQPLGVRLLGDRSSPP
jgi:small-conductance mechanosensitive channel